MDIEKRDREILAPALRPGSEGISSFYRFLILLVSFMAALVLAAFLLWMLFSYFFNHALFLAVLAGLVEIWGFVRMLAVVGAGIGTFWAGGLAVTSVLQKLPRRESITFDEKENLVLAGLFGSKQFSFQKTQIAERRATRSKIGATKIELVPPGIPMQIQERMIYPGMPADMLIYGFEVKTMQPIRLQKASSSLTIGGTGSGKTRANAWRSLERLLIDDSGGYTSVSICDPHYQKPDGLTNLVAPVEGYLRIARTPQEIYKTSKEFYEEMERRKAGTSKEMIKPGIFKPRHIAFDEWAEIMDTAQPNYPYSDEQRALILGLAIGCVHAYRGFGGYVHLAMQNPKQSNIGDISLRDDMPLLLVHKVSENVCSFLYPSSIEADKRRAVLKLKGRQCFLDSRTEEVQFITEMCEVMDDVAFLFLELLQQSGIQPQFKKPISLPAPGGSLPAPGNDLKEIEIVQRLWAVLNSGEAAPPPAPTYRRVTQPLASASDIDTDELEEQKSRQAEVEAEAAPEAIGREVVLQMLDDVTTGKISAHDFLKWAKANGGRKYTGRAETIRQIQEIANQQETEGEL